MNEEQRGDAAARALDALSAEEAARFDAAADAADRAELESFREVAGELSSLTEEAPPADLRGRLLAQLDAVPQEAPTAAAAPAVPASPAVRAIPNDPGPVERAAQRRWFQRPGRVLAAAAATAAVLLGGMTLGQWMTGPDELAEILHASDVQTANATLEDGSTATVIWSGEQGGAAIIFDELAELDAEQVYEAWYIRGDEAIPAGTFDAAADGASVYVLDGAMHAGDTVGVTIEPAGGSDTPTTPPILVSATA